MSDIDVDARALVTSLLAAISSKVELGD